MVRKNKMLLTTISTAALIGCLSGALSASAAVATFTENITSINSPIAKSDDPNIGVRTVLKDLTSKNGVLTISVPEQSGWKEIASNTACVTFSDGDDTIVFTHCKSAEQIPDVKKVDAKNVKTFQEILGTSDYYMSLSGYCVDPTDSEYNIMVYAIKSAVICEDKIEKEEHVAVASNFSVRDDNRTMYVTASELCVRSEGNTSGKEIGSLSRNTEVHVTGVVQKDGKDTNWVRIDYANISAFVCADFLTYDKPISPTPVPDPTKAPTPSPEPTPEPVIIEKNGNVLRIWRDYDDVFIFEYTNGSWYDDYGVSYIQINETTWFDGANYYSTLPPEEPDPSAPSCGLYTIYGDYFTIYQSEDGNWYDDDGIRYYEIDYNTWCNERGMTFYIDLSEAPSSDDDIDTVPSDDIDPEEITFE